MCLIIYFWLTVNCWCTKDRLSLCVFDVSHFSQAWLRYMQFVRICFQMMPTFFFIIIYTIIFIQVRGSGIQAKGFCHFLFHFQFVKNPSPSHQNVTKVKLGRIYQVSRISTVTNIFRDFYKLFKNSHARTQTAVILGLANTVRLASDWYFWVKNIWKSSKKVLESNEKKFLLQRLSSAMSLLRERTKNL